jgi:23S rRNA pseudouridine2605 synthase
MTLAPKSGERIAKVIARAGICSRRDAEKMIAAGRVKVDGVVIKSPALDVTPDQAILVDGTRLPVAEHTRLFRFHKKRGLVTTARDPQGRPTVFDALPPGLPRLISIGRLDINSEGLLLLTNDGGLARQLELPATGWVRRYRVRVNGDVEPDSLKKLAGGLTIDGVRYGPVRAALDRQQGDNAWLSMSLTEGKNREVRKLCEHLGWKVNRLIRIAYGPFQLGDLEPGVVEEVTGKVLREQLGKAAPKKPAQGRNNADRRRQS